MALEFDVSVLTGSLKKKWQDIDKDETVSPVEFQSLRDEADKRFTATPALASIRAGAQLDEALATFQQAADELSEAMQRAALAARRLKMSEADRGSLKEGMEYQLSYVIAAYKTSVERL
ncbi:hypothetical protein [Luteibacter sp. CQ10]|uniref:hypothetical protein n=1 Tax=Luteibacter sp. CQ10 TaxID=2805821 RepID=UPI0034A1A097